VLLLDRMRDRIRQALDGRGKNLVSRQPGVTAGALTLTLLTSFPVLGTAGHGLAAAASPLHAADDRCEGAINAAKRASVFFNGLGGHLTPRYRAAEELVTWRTISFFFSERWPAKARGVWRRLYA